MILLVSTGTLSLLLVPLMAVREPWDLNETPDRLRNLKRARDRVMRTLKDIENDLREGSLSTEDYEELRSAYKKEAIQVSRELKRVREIVVRQIADGPERPLGIEEREKLESMIERRRKKYE